MFFPGGVEEQANPMERERLDRCVRRLDEESGPHHAIAITGGEPLLFVDYLLPLLDAWSWPILLETAGHRPDDLERVIDSVDIVMADIKLDSSAGVSFDTRRFLQIASRKECAAKVVCSARTTTAEIEQAAAQVPDGVPLVLQPVTGSRFDPPQGAHMLALQRAAMRRLKDTRIIPQTHRVLHLR